MRRKRSKPRVHELVAASRSDVRWTASVLRIVLLVAILLVPVRARAVDVALNLGVIEALELPGGAHIGAYPSVGVSLAFPLKHVTLIPSLSVEMAETGRWGFVVSFVNDFPVRDWIGVDLDVTLIHDQPGGDFRKSELLLGAGIGCSFFFGKNALSPFINVFRDLSVAGWAIVPGINLAAGL